VYICGEVVLVLVIVIRVLLIFACAVLEVYSGKINTEPGS